MLNIWRSETQVKQSLLRRNSLKAHAVGPVPGPDDKKTLDQTV